MHYLKIFVLSIFLGLLPACLESSRSAPERFSGMYGDQVVLYTTKWCGYCQKMREYLARHRIKYIEYDIEASIRGHGEFQELGGRGIPLTLVKGRIVDGYAPKAVLQIVRGE